ncbi:AMP-binding protein [Nonomuraea sp. NPDC048901]|uniref:phenylacetate--CoA ligase family protein n=1 Tax=Nonomuraea sp. NPDC048901 TaxID=3155627 RepID=UPI0033CEF70F
MFGTAARQLGYAWSMLAGRRFRVKDVTALVEDLRATLEEFGSPGEGAGEMLTAPDPEMQRDLATRRLRRTLRLTARDTPYYRRWFEQHGIDPGSITLESLASIEPTTKAALRDLPSAFVADGASPAVLAQTTGTTGVPTMVWFSRYEIDLMSGMSALALMLAGGLRSEHVWANCITSRSIAQILIERAATMTGAAFAHVGLVDPRATLDRLAVPLHVPGKRPQVTHLNTTASYLAALVQEAERGGWDAKDFGLEEIHSGGEVLTDALKERAEAMFGARVLDSYSMTEIAPVGGQVCGQGHLHLPTDQGHVEVLDPETFQPAAPGAHGVLVVTPYTTYRDTTLLLRYVTGDIVKVLPEGEQPACELAAVPATSRVLGRLSPSSVTTRDVLDLLQAEREIPLPTRYVLEETRSGPVLHAVTGNVSRALVSRLEERAADLGLPLRGIELVDDPAALPGLCRVRADLREHTFEHFTATESTRTGKSALRAAAEAVAEMGVR